MLRSLLKQVVIAGMTPFQFIVSLLALGCVPVQHFLYGRPDFPRAQGTRAGGPNLDSIGRETVSPAHILCPGMGPFRNASATLPRARTDAPVNENTERLRSGKRSFPLRTSS